MQDNILYESNNIIPGANILTVSDLTNKIKQTLNSEIGTVTIRGEVSSLKCHSSGHVYFNLKDNESIINAVCFKWTYQRSNIKLEEGVEFVLTGKITCYRSYYQINVESFKYHGEGSLLVKLEQIKNKLKSEGLFDDINKKPLMVLPEKIVIITSKTGAVIEDILKILNQSVPTKVIILNVLVQGKEAADQIINAILKAKTQIKPDTIIIARGGGSMEDLWAFNSEDLARCVHACDIPIISAIGHETDTTIIDYVADKRAPTPTAAAKMVIMSKTEFRDKITILTNKINAYANSRVDLQISKIINIENILQKSQQKIDHHILKMSETKSKILHLFDKNIMALSYRLSQINIISPKNLVISKKHQYDKIKNKIDYLYEKHHSDKKNRFKIAVNMINAMSYQNVLKRGYAMIKSDDKKIITSVKNIKKDQKININLHDGTILAKTI